MRELRADEIAQYEADKAAEREAEMRASDDAAAIADLASQEQEEHDRMFACPIKLDKIHCQNCSFSKESLCDYPYKVEG